MLDDVPHCVLMLPMLDRRPRNDPIERLLDRWIPGDDGLATLTSAPLFGTRLIVLDPGNQMLVPESIFSDGS